jgi:hypothetical protein
MHKNVAYAYGAIVATILVVVVVRGGSGIEPQSLPSDAGTAITEPVEEMDLPSAVLAAVHSRPRAIYVSGTKVTRGQEVEYHLTLRGTHRTAMIVKPDGTVVSFQ